MFVYLAIFAVVSLGVLLGRPNPDPRRRLGALAVVLFAIGLLIGFRYKVGGDWENYQLIFRFAASRTFDQIMARSETLFQLLNWAVATAEWPVWVVNVTCGLIFAAGLGTFARRQPDPWLVVAAAVPYLITVVAMGYTRQGVAIGLLLAGLADFFGRRSTMRFAAWVVIAALFHRTAVVAFPIVALANPRNRLINAAIAIAASFALYDLFLDDAMTSYVRNYVDAGYSSQGAAIRVALSAVAALVLLVATDRLGFPPVEKAVWRNFALVTIGLVLALGLSPSSTAVDRIALYVLPLQIAVFGRMPALFKNWQAGRMVVLAIEGTFLVGWLTLAVHARYWVPYQFYPV